jgi:hypothetical protein
MKLPREPWRKTATLFEFCVQANTARAIESIETKYERRNRLEEILEFISLFLTDGVRSKLSTLQSVSFFPWVECEAEIEYALAYALAGLHRACFDHARRALELVVVGAYFVADHIDEQEGAAWLRSDKETPLFSRAIKGLAKDGFSREVLERTGWKDTVQKHYWGLSDSVHVRGQKFSLRELQSSRTNINGFPMAGFSAERLTTDTLIETCEHILVALVLANPVLLFGVPVTEKYGLNEPSGFFEDGQSEALRALLPPALRDELVALASADEGVLSLRTHFESMHDLTPEEIQAQIEDLPF